MKHAVSEQALALVEKEVIRLGGSVTPQDAAAATGLTIVDAQSALERMMELFVTRVGYDETGRILFNFPLPLRNRGTKTLAEKWAGVRDQVLRVAKVTYKVGIAFFLLGYFLVVVALVVALALAGMAATDDDDAGSAGSAVFTGIFRVLAEGIRFAFWSRAFGAGGYDVDDHGYRYRKARVPEGTGKNKKKKSLIVAVYDYALGPDRAEVDPLENEKKAGAFLRAEGGVLTPTEVLALSGGDFGMAEERMADYLARFGGEPQLTEEGIVVGEFADFLERGTEVDTGGEIVPFWQEFEAPYKVTGNSKGRNAAIAFVGGATCFGGGILGLGGGLADLAFSYGPFFATDTAFFLLGTFPMWFGLSYFAMPFLRFPFVRRNEQARLVRNRRKLVMRVIFEKGLWRTTPEEVFANLPAQAQSEFDHEEVATELEALLRDLQRDIENDETGRSLYTFGRPARELAEAQKVRARLGTGSPGYQLGG